MGNTLLNIRLEALIPNDENDNFSMNDIDILEESIRQHGVLTPLTVYLNDDETGYTILSGHRRYEACKRLGIDTIPVQIVNSPKTRIDEFESICEANIARNSDEDKKLMIKNAAEFWEQMADSDKKIITEKLKKRYLSRVGDLDAFKPRNEYVRAITGITVSDRTIIRKLNNAQPTISPVEEEPKKSSGKKKTKTRTFSKFCHDSIYELEYKLSENTDEELPLEVQNAITQLLVIMKEYSE